MHCTSEPLRRRIERLVALGYSATHSLSDTFGLIPSTSSMLFQGPHSDVVKEEHAKLEA